MSEWIAGYFKWGNALEEQYPDLNFKNHCYWRIALDSVMGRKWDEVIPRPAYKHLHENELKSVVHRLEAYHKSKALLLSDNAQSLKWRR